MEPADVNEVVVKMPVVAVAVVFAVFAASAESAESAVVEWMMVVLDESFAAESVEYLNRWILFNNKQ